jgi:Putative metallopeptidase
MTAARGGPMRRPFPFARLALAAGVLFCVPALAPVLAQPAQPTVEPSAGDAYQARIEAAARAMETNARFKGLTQEQRIDRVEFVVGNTLFILLHEMGHVHIHENRLPILGREEDAADTFAVLRLLRTGWTFSERVLVEASKGWFYSDRRDQQTGAPILFYDEHGLNQQRAYQIVCLMYGSDPARFKDLADQTRLPEARRESCKNDYAYASWSWDTVLAPTFRKPEQPRATIEVVYENAEPPFDVIEKSFRALRFLETVADISADLYVWPQPFTMKMHSCKGPNAGYDDVTRVLEICYQIPFDFSELYRAYGGTPFFEAQRTPAKAPNERKTTGRARGAR